MKQLRLTDHPLNKHRIISSGWSHNTRHYKFARTMAETGVRWAEPKKFKLSKLEIILGLLAAFSVSFIGTFVVYTFLN